MLSGCNQCEKVLFVLKNFQNRDKNKDMLYHLHFKASLLPTPMETRIGAPVTKAVNQTVSCVLSQVNEPVKKKQKVYSAFTD